MKVLQIGLGEFGMSWFKDILVHHEQVSQIILVDQNPEKLTEAKQYDYKRMCLYYQSLEEALNEQKVDLVLNATPPHIHRQTVEQALEFGVPILLEKPIATCYKDAFTIMKHSEEKNVPIMIAENYRYKQLARKTKELLNDGVIGNIASINIEFYRNHRMENYHKNLEEPLLLDVSIHHLDVVRYLTGGELETVCSRLFNPSWSWYKGNASVHLDLMFSNNIVVNYRGSLASHTNDTGWNGSWRIEGEKGVLYIKDNIITVINEEGELTYEINETSDGRKQVLNELFGSLRDGRRGETDIHDNIRTLDIVQKAIKQNITKH